MTNQRYTTFAELTVEEVCLFYSIQTFVHPLQHFERYTQRHADTPDKKAYVHTCIIKLKEVCVCRVGNRRPTQ